MLGDVVEPVVENSAWVNGSVYELTGCPSGCSVYPGESDVFDATTQRCEPCLKGEECMALHVVCGNSPVRGVSTEHVWGDQAWGRRT